jgi:hypothetical protein
MGTGTLSDYPGAERTSIRLRDRPERLAWHKAQRSRESGDGLNSLVGRADSPKLDGSALFVGVLNPGERMVWSYRRQPIFSRSLLTRFAIVASVLWFGAFMLLHDISGKGQQRPLWLRVELFCSAGWFFILPVFLCWLHLRSARNTAYALTDRRLLMALGPERTFSARSLYGHFLTLGRPTSEPHPTCAWMIQHQFSSCLKTRETPFGIQ